MGSATRQALGASTAALSSLGTADVATGEQLLAAGRVIGDSAQLLTALSDSSAASADKVSIIESVFSKLSAGARSLLATIVSNRWSNDQDLLAAIEELGFRVLARSANGVKIEDELFSFGTVVGTDQDLELAVSSKLGSAADKSALVQTLLAKKASAQTVAIVDHLVQQPRGRRIAALLREAASIVADESGLAVATVTSAAPIDAKQLDRIAAALSKANGRDLRINHVIDPSIVGGIRVQIGDEVIDGSVATKLNDLRLQLAS
jgi:F-type H+-transporting ATPase subunit delta